MTKVLLRPKVIVGKRFFSGRRYSGISFLGVGAVFFVSGKGPFCALSDRFITGDITLAYFFFADGKFPLCALRDSFVTGQPNND